MENSYVPPEVVRQYSQQDDQKDDQPDDQSSSTQSTGNTPASFDPGQSVGSATNQQGNGLAGQDQFASGGEGSSNTSQTLSLKEQLKMLSPLGFLTALLGLQPSQQELENRQKQAAKQEQLVFQSQQQWQARQAQEQQSKMALREEQESIRTQGRSFGKPRADSVLFQRVTDNPSQADTQLLTRSAKDAQELRARAAQTGNAPKGKQQGPVDFGTLAQQNQGMQKASEMTMGE